MAAIQVYLLKSEGVERHFKTLTPQVENGVFDGKEILPRYDFHPRESGLEIRGVWGELPGHAG